MLISKEVTIQLINGLIQEAQLKEGRASDEFEATHGHGVIDGIRMVLEMIERQVEITD